MKTQDLKQGDKIEVLNHITNVWEEVEITKATEKSIWFNGSGYNHIKKQTLISRPMFYRLPVSK